MPKPVSKQRKPRKPASTYFQLSEIPSGAKGFRARNGIAARLYRYMTHDWKFRQSPQAVSVPVPHTTLPEAFRIYILNYLKHRKKLNVRTSLTKSRTEVLVWLRDNDWDRDALKVIVPLPQSVIELAPLWPPGKDSEYAEDDEDAVDEYGTPIIYV